MGQTLQGERAGESYAGESSGFGQTPGEAGRVGVARELPSLVIVAESGAVAKDQPHMVNGERQQTDARQQVRHGCHPQKHWHLRVCAWAKGQRSRDLDNPHCARIPARRKRRGRRRKHASLGEVSRVACVRGAANAASACAGGEKAARRDVI